MNHLDKNNYQPSDDEMRNALARVIASNTFASAPRLQQFLSYLVAETIAGRGDSIKGKAVAVEVYGRKLLGDSGQNLVRVEARRLRRSLDEYYSDAGAGDPWRIQIDLGGYTPRFESRVTSEPVSPKPSSHRVRPPAATWTILLTSLILLVVLAIAVAWKTGIGESDPGAENIGANLAAYRERSVQALQAVNLAEQARGMFFPVFDMKRQQIALEMYQHAISLDPGLHHGYAGSAQVLATLAFLSPNESSASDYESQAVEMASKALDIAPSDAWSQAAQGWVLAVSGDLERAHNFAQRAAKLAPENGHVLDLVGITAIVTNHPEFAEEVSNTNRTRYGTGRFGANNIWGVSQLMLGHYEEVKEAFSTAPEKGIPVSAPSLIFLVVAYDHTGDKTEARRVAAELSASWPDFPVHHIVRSIFINAPITGDDILESLAKYGYPADA